MKILKNMIQYVDVATKSSYLSNSIPTWNLKSLILHIEQEHQTL
jgi:hypothetical protein